MIAFIGEYNERKTMLKRPPFRFECTCGQEDWIVLPRGTGVLRWVCGFCKAKYHAPFGLHEGDVFKDV